MKSKSNRWTPVEMNKLIAYHKNHGWSKKDIAKHLGRSMSAVNRIFTQLKKGRYVMELFFMYPFPKKGTRKYNLMKKQNYV
jgi:hypothetical protein